jgi:type IV pilus biogenesis protein PilP
MVMAAKRSRFHNLKGSSLRTTLLGAVAISIIAAAVGHAQVAPSMGNAEVISGDQIDRNFGVGRPAGTPPSAVPWGGAAPAAQPAARPVAPATPSPVVQPQPSQARPAPTPAAPVGQAAPAGAQPRPVAQPAQPVMPALPAGAVAPVSPGDPVSSSRQPIRLPTASSGAVVQTEVQPSNEIEMSEEEAVRQIESLTRQRRIFEMQRHVEAEKLAIERALAERRKVISESRGPAQPPVIEAAPPPPPMPAPSASSALEQPDGDIVTQMSVLSITGPADRLVATVRVNGFGNVQVRTGGTLPGNVRVVSLSSNGLAVRAPAGGTRLVPFAQ